MFRAQKVRLVRSYFTEQEFCLVLERRDRTEVERKPTARELEILERALLGAAQKAIAIDFGLSPSTISASLRGTLLRLGFPADGGLPILLMMAAWAARPETSQTRVPMQAIRFGARSSLILWMPRPDRHFAARLTRAERDLVRMLVEGLNHARISKSRNTSSSTTANQLGSVYRKLRISGRNQMLSFLARAALDPAPA